MFRLLYKLFRKRFLRYEGELAPSRDLLKYAFTDINGKRYYVFSDLAGLPWCRYIELFSLYIFWQGKIAPETLDKISKAIISNAERALTETKPEVKAKAYSGVITLASQLMFRGTEILPVNVFHAMAAVMVIEEGENFKVFDKEIQQRKVEALINETNLGRDFFLNLPNLMTFLNLLNLSSPELLKQLEVSTVKEQVESKIVDYLSSRAFKNTNETV